MIKVYLSPSCSSCRKVKEYFKSRKIPFVAVDIFKDLNYGDLLYLLTKSENGTEDIISTRSKIIKESKIDLDKMKLSEIINFILANPTILRRPIIVDDKEMQVGYNTFEIASFVPRAREIANKNCSLNLCPTFATCEHNKDKESNKTI